MKKILIEFMDSNFIPMHLRKMLIEILEYSLDILRKYYDKCAEEINKTLLSGNYKNVYELGAGTAQLSYRLFKKIQKKTTIIPSDLNPDEEHFKNLEKISKGIIKPEYNVMNMKDFKIKNPENMVVFSASFHHLTKNEQIKLLKNIKHSKKIMIFEPLCRNLINILKTTTLVLPLLAFPLFRPKLSHFFWCWIIPVAPFLFIWDGIATCFRQNDKDEWIDIFKKAGIKKYQININKWEQFICIN